MYVAKIGFCRTYHSTTSFPRASTGTSDLGAAIAQGCLALSPIPARGDPATALVPAEMAEVLGPRELFPGENRSVDAHELVVEGACIAYPDPAFHVPLEARLNRYAPFPGQVHDRVHHLLRPAREDLLERLAREELVRQGGLEPVESAGAVVRRDVYLPGRVRAFDEEEFLRTLGASRGHDPNPLLRKGLDCGDHGGHPAPAADREDGLALQPEHVPVRSSDADPVSGGEGGQGVSRIAIVADGDALHRAEVGEGHGELVVSRNPDHQELARLAAEIRSEAIGHRRRRLPDDLQEGNDLDPRHGRPQSPQEPSGSPLPRGGRPFPLRLRRRRPGPARELRSRSAPRSRRP